MNRKSQKQDANSTTVKRVKWFFSFMQFRIHETHLSHMLAILVLLSTCNTRKKTNKNRIEETTIEIHRIENRQQYIMNGK